MVILIIFYISIYLLFFLFFFSLSVAVVPDLKEKNRLKCAILLWQMCGRLHYCRQRYFHPSVFNPTGGREPIPDSPTFLLSHIQVVFFCFFRYKRFWIDGARHDTLRTQAVTQYQDGELRVIMRKNIVTVCALKKRCWNSRDLCERIAHDNWLFCTLVCVHVCECLWMWQIKEGGECVAASV